jgi:hypothetical protein
MGTQKWWIHNFDLILKQRTPQQAAEYPILNKINYLNISIKWFSKA